MKVQFLEYFILGFILLCFVVYYENFSSEMVQVKSNIDNETYTVRNLTDKQQAANMLATLRRNMKNLVDYVQNQKQGEDKYCRGAITVLKDRFRPNKMSESPSNAKFTSYSVNKGEKIFFCLRLKDETNQLIDENTLTFVAIHELAHVMTKSIGHTPEFWNNFRFLLRHAVRAKIYRYQKFSENPEKYCGMSITDTPYKPERDDDPSIKNTPNETKSCR